MSDEEPRFYVTIRLTDYIDGKTGEPRSCHHVVDQESAERIALELRLRWPDTTVTIHLK